MKPLTFLQNFVKGYMLTFLYFYKMLLIIFRTAFFLLSASYHLNEKFDFELLQFWYDTFALTARIMIITCASLKELRCGK